MADLKTDYKDDILDTSQNLNRTFSVVDNTTGTVIYPNVSLEETTKFTQEGDSHSATITNEQNEAINQINNDLSDINNDCTYGNQIIANISASTGAEVGKYIRENVLLSKLQKGYVFNLIPSQTPGWWSGILFCDSPTWTTGATCWGFYMNRDTNVIYKYNCTYGGTDSITRINAEHFNYANARTITLPYTCTENGLFIAIVGDGSVAGTRDIIINGTQVAILTASSNGARETASFIVSKGDTISSGIAFWGTCKFIPTKS